MNVARAGVLFLLALGAAAAHAADRGLYTVVDGDVRVLRKTTWYRLEPGAHAESGDIVEAGKGVQVQLELTGGNQVGIVGPALFSLDESPDARDRAERPAELTVAGGWFKAAVTAKSRPLTLRAPTSVIGLSDGVAVVHVVPALLEVFVESGRASAAVPVARGKDVVRDAGAGEYLRRVADRAFVTDDRPPAAFIASMPRELRDALPRLGAHFTGPQPALAAGREVTFAEAEPWLTGASRKVFARRFAPRLADPAFRAAATAARPVPEWDRTLHPEKYRPPTSDGSPGPTVTRPAPLHPRNRPLT